MRIIMRSKSEPAGGWRLVSPAAYGVEVDLHSILADAPSLIPTDEMAGRPAPFLVAVSEFGLRGSGSTDLVLLNADGEIALVECKLATNAEIKRKVVGQILEYGAYMWGMSYEDVDAGVQRRLGTSLAEAMRAAVADPDWNEEGFRTQLSQVLQKGAFRLIIAVDEMNEELARTVSFLNGCGRPTFSFHALSLPRYQSEDSEMLVPSLHGPGPEDTPQHPTTWDEQRFARELDKLEPAARDVALDLHRWIKQKADYWSWGTGAVTGSSSFYLRSPQGRDLRLFTVYTHGKLELSYGSFPGTGLEPLLEKLHERLRQLPGFSSLPTAAQRYPNVSLAGAFTGDARALATFKEALLAFVAEARTFWRTSQAPGR